MRGLVAALVLIVACGGGQAPSARAPSSSPAGPTNQPSPTQIEAPSPPRAPEPLHSPIALAGVIEEFRSDTARLPSSAASEAELREMVAADTAFALRLYHELVEDETGNAFLSPYSISTAFSMVLPGSRGQTAEELTAALRVGAHESTWHAARNRLELALLAAAEYEYPGEGDVQPMTIEPTNAIFGQAGYPFKSPFLDILAANYGAGPHALDFIGHPDPSRLAINEWVAERTRDRIEELLPDGTINDMTRFVLVNAIYFKAGWAREFSADATYPEPFHLLDGSTVETPMMHSTSKNDYASGDGWQAVRLHYWGDASMLVILPEPGRFAEIEARLDPDLMAEVRTALATHEVILSLPKWESESTFDLIPAMNDLGVRVLFDRDAADLSGIADVEQMFIAHALHQANITVDEEGTEAAAATALVGEATSGGGAPPATLKVDRPFLYLIQNESTTEILFLGRVLAP